MTKRGGKREGAGRPSKNSVIKPISLPLELLQFVKENNLSLSKLTQQKIKEIMASYVDVTQSISAGDLVEFCVNGDCKRGLIVKIENRFTGDEHIGYKYHISVVGSITPKVVNYDIEERVFFNVENDDSIRIAVLF